MADRAAERRRKRRELVREVHRDYLRPFIMALKNHDSDAVRAEGIRLSDFKRGVYLADPQGKWGRRFNEDFDMVAKEMGYDG